MLTPVVLTPGARLRRYLLGVCVVYTALTVLSSSIALASGQTTDTHLHLLSRLLFVLLGMGAFELVAALRARYPAAPLAVLGLAACAALLVAVLASVWIAGRTGVDLHPDAYRDAVLNVAAVGTGLVAIAAVLDALRRRR